MKVNCVGKDSWTRSNGHICSTAFWRRLIRWRKRSDWARSGRWSLRKHPRIPLIRRCNELFSGTPRSSSTVHRAIIATECITFPSRSTWCNRATFSMLCLAFVFQEPRSNTVRVGGILCWLLTIFYFAILS